MSTSKPISTIATGKPGRPASVRKRAVFLIGSSNVKALDEAGLCIVPRAVISALSLFVGEPMSAHDPELPKPHPAPGA